MNTKILHYFFVNKKQLIMTLIFLLLRAMTWITVIYLLQFIGNAVFSYDLSVLSRLLVYSIGFLILFSLVNLGFNYFLAKLKQNFFIHFKQDVINGIISKEYDEYNSDNVSKYMSMLTNDINLIEQNYFDAMYNLIDNIIMLILTIFVLFQIHYLILVVLLITGIMMFIIPMLTNKYLIKTQDQQSDIYTLFTGKLKNILSGYEVINSFQANLYFKNQLNSDNLKLEKQKFKFIFTKESISVLIIFFAFLCQFSGIFTAGYLISLGLISAGTLIPVIQLGNQIYNSLSYISKNFTAIKSTKNLNQKLLKYVNNNPNINNKVYKKTFNTLTINNLKYSYNNKDYVININNYTFKNNLKYLIIGKNGSGKSTLIKILMGYFQNYEGEITIDQQKVTNVNTLKGIVSPIHQNVYLFAISIKDNITMYKDYDMDKIIEVCKFIGIHEFITNLPNSYDTIIDEAANTLSGGQKQKIIIARALIRDLPILILDEAMSALDINARQEINTVINRITNKTIIEISHNYDDASIQNYDYILELESGKII